MKHILDRSHTQGQAALGRLMTVVRTSLPKRQSVTLQRRQRKRIDDRRLNAYRMMMRSH
ncbi:hypothetical protein [Loktanella sp. S4079]|uniref:hypothetical protein n=1 Tax=Loktanella sp. S4079 TaxID=579483 RepID=UPI000AD2EF02|nr:hypothetical protein [Loktanella sp. S4079]